MSCKKIKPLLHSLLLNELAPDVAEKARHHLLNCEKCRTASEEIRTTLALLRKTLGQRAEIEPKLDERRRLQVASEGLRRRESRHVAWRFAMRAAAVVLISLGLAVLLTPKPQKPRQSAKTRSQPARSETILVQISPNIQQQPRAPAPAAVSEINALPPPTGREPVPAEVSALEAATDRVAINIEQATRNAEMALVQNEQIPAPGQVPLEKLQASLTTKPNAVGNFTTPDRQRAITADKSTLVAEADNTRHGASKPKTNHAKDVSQSPTSKATQPARPRPAAATSPSVFAWSGAGAEPASFALARKQLSEGKWPNPDKTRVEDFLAALKINASPLATKTQPLQAEIAASPFRPGLHLLLLNIRACATNLSSAAEAREAEIRIQINPQRVKRFRLLGFDHQPLKERASPEMLIQAADLSADIDAPLLFEMELQGENTLPIGAVKIQYKTGKNSAPIEIAQTMDRSIINNNPERATPGFRLAAATAELAEALRSPPAESNSLDQVIRLLQRACLEFSLNATVRELSEMAGTARVIVGH